MKEQLNELALFAGAGGGILGGKLLGWRTVCAVEWDAYARDVLVARQNDGCLEAFPIWDDVQTFDGHPWRGIVDVVSGGFPCQDISCAGKGAGIEGSRSSMWKHMARIIGEVRPKYAFVENSPMLVGRGLSTVLSDLAEMGYDARWCVLGASDVGAPHRRERIWIVAHSNRGDDKCRQSERSRICTKKADERPNHNPVGSSKRCEIDVSDSNVRGRDNGGDTERQYETDNTQIGETEKDKQSRSFWKYRTSEDCGDVADTESRESGQQTKWQRRENTIGGDNDRRGDQGKRSEICNSTVEGLQDRTEKPMGEPGADAKSKRSDWWATEPDVGRVAHGVAARVDRLKTIGNGQVPAVAALAWQILSGKEQEKTIGT